MTRPETGKNRKEEHRPAPLQRRNSVWRMAVAVLLLAALSGLCVLTFVRKDRAFSAGENRSLAQLPQVSGEALLDGSFFDDLGEYLTDQVAGRDGWIALNSLAKKLAGQQEIGDVLFGEDDYLLAKPTVPVPEAVQESAQAVSSFADAHADIPVRMLLVPDAASVWPERVPYGAPIRDQVQDIADYEDGLSENVECIDAYAALSAHAKEPLFYHTDHHWTSLGAYRVFQAAAPALGIEPGAYETLTVTDSFRGTLASKSGDHSTADTIDVYVPEDGIATEYFVTYPDTRTKADSMFQTDRLREKDQYTVFFGGNHSIVEIGTTAGNGRNLLIFKDSYANSFVQFLTPYYESITLVDPRYCYDDVERIISSHDITEVLFLYSADILFADTDLADMLQTES